MAPRFTTMPRFNFRVVCMHRRLSFCNSLAFPNLATILDGNGAPRLPTVGSLLFDCFDNFHAINNPAEDNMLPIKMRSGSSAEKELRTICIGPCVGHRKHSWPSVFADKVFIPKLGPVN